jgi:hypothetical protein
MPADEESALHAGAQMSPHIEDGRITINSLPINVPPMPSHIAPTNRATIRQSDLTLKKQPKPPPTLLHP